MEDIYTPRVILSGVTAGVGKSLVGVGLAVALRKRNLSVSCCVNGPNIFQAILYHRTTRRYSRSLDDRLLSDTQILSSVQHAGVGADIVLIEGRDGLYDGRSAGSLRGSDAELASLTRSPVILMVDVSAFKSSIAALIKGYRDMAAGFTMGGVIVNRLDQPTSPDARDKLYFETVLQAFQLDPLMGAVPTLRGDVMMPKGPVNQLHNLATLPRQFIVDVGNLIEGSVNIDRLLTLAQSAPPIRFDDSGERTFPRRCRVAVSEDSCFNLCFQDNLELLRHFGAEIAPFSPLADSSLPRKVGAVYVTGAYLQEYAKELAQNESMKQSLLEFSQRGGVIYSEGAGSAYLCRTFLTSADQETHSGVGVIPAAAVPGPGGFSYCEAVTVEESILGREGLILKGIDTQEWGLSEEKGIVKTTKVRHGMGTPRPEGYSPNAQVLSTFTLNHWGSSPVVAKNLVDAAEVVQKI